MSTIRIAVLDLYNNFRNEGMRCIYQLLRRAEAAHNLTFQVDTFNVRAENQVPGLDYDIYISSGGPGSPLPSDEPWEPLYFEFIDSLLAYNQRAERKKTPVGNLPFVPAPRSAPRRGHRQQAQIHFVWRATHTPDECRRGRTSF